MSKIIIASKDYIPICNILGDSYAQELCEGYYFYGTTFITSYINRNSNLKEGNGVFYTQQLKRKPIKLLAITCIKNTSEIITACKEAMSDILLKTQFFKLHSHFFVNKDLLETPELKGSRLFKSFINSNLKEFKKKKKEYVHYLEEWEFYKMFIIDQDKLLDKHIFKESNTLLKNEFIQFFIAEIQKEKATKVEAEEAEVEKTL